MEQLLTAAEAATYLRVRQATLRRWRQEGRVRGFKPEAADDRWEQPNVAGHGREISLGRPIKRRVSGKSFSIELPVETRGAC